MVKITDFLAYHPLSEFFVMPPGRTAKELVTLLLARQKAVYGYTILDGGNIPRVALTRNMKKLMAKYALDDIKRGIELTVLTSDYPASTKFIEDMIKWRRDLIQYQPYSR